MLNAQCSEMKRMKLTNSKEIYDRIKALSGRNSRTCSGCIKAKGGRILVDDKDIMKRQTEYTAELCKDDRRERPIVNRNMDGPQIMELEVRAAMKKIKRNKARGPNDINIQIPEALEDFSIKTVTKIANDIQNWSYRRASMQFFICPYHQKTGGNRL